jgi:hypothetical protein
MDWIQCEVIRRWTLTSRRPRGTINGLKRVVQFLATSEMFQNFAAKSASALEGELVVEPPRVAEPDEALQLRAADGSLAASPAAAIGHYGDR